MKVGCKHRDSQVQVWSAWKIMKIVRFFFFNLKSRPSSHSWVRTPGKARLFISDQSKEVSQDRERRRRKLYPWIQTAMCFARMTQGPWACPPSIQTFRPSFVVSLRFSTGDTSLESLRSQQCGGVIFVPTSPRKWTNESALFKKGTQTFGSIPRTHTCSGQINLY